MRGNAVNKHLEILGDGQVWDLRGILSDYPQKTFEDLFSGRALAQMAKEVNQHLPPGKKIFSQFKEKGKITGLSVTRALLEPNREAKKQAILLLKELAKNGASGIAALTEGRGFKEHWVPQKRAHWKDLDAVIIGGGVSEGLTGKTLVRLIQNYLCQARHSRIQVTQAKLPGKEAGFLGGIINTLKIICTEAKEKNLKVIGAIGIDLGREEIGVGLSAINPNTKRNILSSGKNYWLLRQAVKTACSRERKIFLDSRHNYTLKERRRGERCRQIILKQIAGLIIQAAARAQRHKLATAQNIGVATPGSTTPDGYILNSTDYLPFFRKQDGFNFARALEGLLVKKGLSGYSIHIINDGIAAGMANVYFSHLERGKVAFLGVGSGLGGFIGKVGAG